MRRVLWLLLVVLTAAGLGWATGVQTDAGIVFAAGDFKLPAGPQQQIYVTQGNFSDDDHIAKNLSQYAFDFAASSPSASFTIVAAHQGTISEVRDDSPYNCSDLTTYTNLPKGQTPPPGACWTQANYILIDDGDGTTQLYMHLTQASANVKVGDRVDQGQLLAVAGDTGWSTSVHLHFEVEKTPNTPKDPTLHPGWWWTQSVPVSFSDKAILAKYPNGVPTYDGIAYLSDNTPPPPPIPPPTPTLTLTQPQQPPSAQLKPPPVQPATPVAALIAAAHSEDAGGGHDFHEAAPFFTKTVTITYSGGKVVLAAKRDGTGTILVDDVLHVTGPRNALTVDFSHGCSVNLSTGGDIPPLDISALLQPGQNAVTLSFADACGGFAANSDIWLVSGAR